MKRIFPVAAQRIALMLALSSVAAVPAIASERNWKLDADHSTARILLGSNAVNIGVARVGGNVKLDTAEPTNSTLDLSIDPAGGKLISFSSQRETMTPDGKLEVVGDLMLQRLVPKTYLNVGEDYYGPVYGELSLQTVMREITFVLPMHNLRMHNRGEKAEITAEARIFRENFPELFAAVNDVNWQPVILDKACEMPPPSEGYAGAACTGTVVAPDRGADFAQVGEDYHGFESAAPKGNLMTIVLNLRLTVENPDQVIASKLR
jgi:hypothetical protein